jgi:hypothetical protein
MKEHTIASNETSFFLLHCGIPAVAKEFLKLNAKSYLLEF